MAVKAGVYVSPDKGLNVINGLMLTVPDVFFEKAMKEEVYTPLLRVMHRAQSNLARMGSNRTGDLSGSMTVSKIKSKDLYEVVLTSTSDYFDIVDGGTVQRKTSMGYNRGAMGTITRPEKYGVNPSWGHGFFTNALGNVDPEDLGENVIANVERQMDAWVATQK